MKRNREVCLITIGFRVLEKVPVNVDSVQCKIVPLSSMYTCESAAREFCELAKKNGHPNAYVESVQRYSEDGYVALSRGRPR